MNWPVSGPQIDLRSANVRVFALMPWLPDGLIGCSTGIGMDPGIVAATWGPALKKGVVGCFCSTKSSMKSLAEMVVICSHVYPIYA
ncbi:MAG: hypothetical protein KZQ99_19825 [Candidatus Thiodiazotropha sp. (ex Dulcina madagascariensis)]|nr:hypothetical protein [Candidatus Thiodiazotropha sp. (ex Dulcina madagascariensis)]